MNMINFYQYYTKPTELDNFFRYGEPLNIISSTNYQSRFETDGKKFMNSVNDSTWTPIRHILKKWVQYAYYYANEVIHDRWYEAEPYLKTDPGYAYYYAKNVIKGRWIEAEPYILADSKYAIWYAINVKKSR